MIARGQALLAALQAVPFGDRDAWIDAQLGIEPPPADAADLPRDAVPYLPCPVDDIVAMVRDAPLRAGDVLVDLGSGLGRVAIIAHLLSGVRAVGVEIQQHLVERSQRHIAALGLAAAITIVHGNAADVAVDGSVYFLYAPCNGELLARVVERLAAVARRRSIVVCTVGLELHAPWLVARPTSSVALAVYDAGACYRARP